MFCVKAVETGLNVLWGAKVNLQSSWLDPAYNFSFDSTQLFVSKSAQNLISQQPELQTYFHKTLNIYKVENNFTGGEVWFLLTSQLCYNWQSILVCLDCN